jgi:hypothetical protein
MTYVAHAQYPYRSKILTPRRLVRPWSPSLPDARGPKEGLAVPSPAAAAAAEWPGSPMLARARTEAREFYDREAWQTSLKPEI